MGVWQLLGDLHPKLVHFPLVLLLAGLLFDAAGLWWGSGRAHWAGRILTVSGTVFLLVAFICGIYAEVWAGRAGIPQARIETHELMANIASWGFVILAAWRLLLGSTSRWGMRAYVVIGLLWYPLMVVTGWLGGQLVYEYGAAVTGARGAGPVSLHDLSTLGARQTDLNLRYSEMMHHMAGYMTLALAGSLLVQALVPGRARQLRWVGPVLLLVGGVALFFYADLDLYKLTDLRQLRDREVLLHKTIAIVLAVVGVAGLRRGIGEKAARLTVALPEEYQGRLVAVVALIGGGLLFTHVHTVAPYANVAAGVYIAHVVMGLLALSIGAARLLADVWPRRRRGLGVAFAGLMAVEAFLLVTYNEGLPWYIGYGRYNRWGPHGGTVAPYGDRRAELLFDDATQRLEVWVLDRFRDTPKPVAAERLEVLIARGYQEIAVPVVAEDGEAEHAHFAAAAPALKGVAGFSARMGLPVARGWEEMGYFDPWVTPAITPVPPNEVAKYVCPMHDGIRSQSPGDCKLCGMPLVEYSSRPRETLHDAGYDMRLDVGGGDGLERELVFTPLKDGATLRAISVTHEHLVHLMVVSSDLVFFDHVHPDRREDGAFVLRYSFPRPGQYLLFADSTPVGERNQVFRFPVAVGAGGVMGAPAAELTASTVLAGPLEQDPSITAELIPGPRRLVAGLHAELRVRLEKDGRPLTDLEPYLGAMGHCVIISEDTQMYLHCHPEQVWTPEKEDRGGPEVVFHTRFPRPGRYKMWAQFQREGRVLVAPFVVEVKASWVPAGVLRAVLEE